MPVTMSIIKSDDNLAKSFDTGNQDFLALPRLNELPVYDSISGINLQENPEESNAENDFFSCRKSICRINSLKPGQSDTLHTPVDIPVAGVNMKMDYITIYHLKSVREKSPFLTCDVNFNLNMEVRDLAH